MSVVTVERATWVNYSLISLITFCPPYLLESQIQPLRAAQANVQYRIIKKYNIFDSTIFQASLGA